MVVRAAYACTTPLISSIGHEDDWTLLDLVADLRASTPTDAAKRVVPDVREQSQLIEGAHRPYATAGSVRAWRTRFDLSRDMRTARA